MVRLVTILLISLVFTTCTRRDHTKWKIVVDSETPVTKVRINVKTNQSTFVEYTDEGFSDTHYEYEFKDYAQIKITVEVGTYTTGNTTIKIYNKKTLSKEATFGGSTDGNLYQFGLIHNTLE